jgi:hypothetical protein
VTPVVDFTSADFDSVNADLTSYAQATFSDRWTDFNDTQFAVMIKELVSYVGDLLSYQVNSTIREAFSATVMRRQNLQNLGKTYGYQLTGAVPATGVIVATLDPAGTYPTTIQRTDQYANGASGDSQVIFHPTNDTVVASYPAGGTLSLPVTQGIFYESILIGVSNGTPNQQWQFPQQGVYSPSITITVGAQIWTVTANFVNNKSTDTVFKIIQTDDGNTFAVFGDGVFGAIPANGIAITAQFNVGGGILGNLNKSTVQTKVSANPVILSVNNPADTNNGNDPQSMKSGRNGIPAFLSTLERGVTGMDYEQLAVQVPGVLKARSGPGVPVGARVIRVWIAPSGGGPPTAQLLSTASNILESQKMVTNRLSLLSPFYKNVFFTVLLHVNSGFRASDVEALVRSGIVNTDQTGLLDFPQLDFGGVSHDANGNEELLLTQTSLHGYFNSLSTAGLDRAEIQQLTVDAVPRTPDTGNTGNGAVTGITLTSRQRRRQYAIQLVSAAQYVVYERITGLVTSLSDTVLSDNDKTFENEGISSFAGYSLVPNANAPQTVVPVISASGADVVVSTTTSLFTLTGLGNTYYLYATPITVWNVNGAPFVSSDGNVSFQVVSGISSFVANDLITLDIYPIVSDIRMAVDEYPVLTSTNFVTRTSGGSPV